MKTNDELVIIANENFKKFTGWDLTYDEMAKLYDDDRKKNPVNDLGSILKVYPNGKKLTRGEASVLFIKWGAYIDGFIAAYRMLDKE